MKGKFLSFSNFFFSTYFSEITNDIHILSIDIRSKERKRQKKLSTKLSVMYMEVLKHINKFIID